MLSVLLSESRVTSCTHTTQCTRLAGGRERKIQVQLSLGSWFQRQESRPTRQPRARHRVQHTEFDQAGSEKLWNSGTMGHIGVGCWSHHGPVTRKTQCCSIQMFQFRCWIHSVMFFETGEKWMAARAVWRSDRHLLNSVSAVVISNCSSKRRPSHVVMVRSMTSCSRVNTGQDARNCGV